MCLSTIGDSATERLSRIITRGRVVGCTRGEAKELLKLPVSFSNPRRPATQPFSEETADVPLHTVVVGGGLAGLAAATALADREIDVTLLESRPRLGGRAGSFLDRDTGEQIDNCQHVSLGCCTNFRHFCETLGFARFLHTARELFFVGPGRDGPGSGGSDGRTTMANGSPRINRFSAARLPAPLHLWPALRRLDYLSRDDRRAIAGGLRALVRVGSVSSSRPPAGQAFDQWLVDHGQTPAAIERFWNVVLVSALSESLDRIDPPHARKVFVDAFLANRRGADVQIPTVPLDEFYGDALTAWLDRRGAVIRLGTGVERVIVENERVYEIQLRDGGRIAADHFVVAVPHHRVLSLLPDPLRKHPRLKGIDRLEAAPISSVHLWFDRPITRLPHAVLIGRLSQWMFNRTALMQMTEHGREIDSRTVRPAAGAEKRFYYQVVISASRDVIGRPREETMAEVVDELRSIFPAAVEAHLLHSRLVSEHKAVFSVRPGTDDLRPPQQSPVPNLQLAGDWTATGWPATMEGAVRSGYRAAENILDQLGRPEQIVRPDLPISLLSRLLLRLR